MPTFTFTSPQGKTYDVVGPEGSTKEQAFQILQGRLGGVVPAPKAEPNIRAEPGLESGGPFDVLQAGSERMGETIARGMKRMAYDEASQNIPRIAGAVLPTALSVVAPTQGLMGLAGRGVVPKLQSSAESIMRHALGGTYAAAKKGDLDVAVKTMLGDKIPLSEKGIGILKEKITDLNNLVTNAIAQSKETIKVSDLKNAISKSLKRHEASPASDLRQIDKEVRDFMNHPLVKGKSEISVQDAQKLKQGFQASVGEKYGQKGTGVDSAQKAIAANLRESVSEKAPEVIDWNKKEQNLIRTLNVAQRRVIMEGAKNPLGLAGLAASEPKTFAVMMADKNRAFHALIARILNASGSRIESLIGNPQNLPEVAAPKIPSGIVRAGLLMPKGGGTEQNPEVQQ